MEAQQWKMKDINCDVPLYDPKGDTYGIVVDGDFIEIPAATFNLMFKRVEAPFGNASIRTAPDIDKARKNQEESLRDRLSGVESLEDLDREFQAVQTELKEALKLGIRIGMTKEKTYEMLVKESKERYNLDFDNEKYKKVFYDLYEEAENELA